MHLVFFCGCILTSYRSFVAGFQTPPPCLSDCLQWCRPTVLLHVGDFIGESSPVKSIYKGLLTTKTVAVQRRKRLKKEVRHQKDGFFDGGGVKVEHDDISPNTRFVSHIQEPPRPVHVLTHPHLEPTFTSAGRG